MAVGARREFMAWMGGTWLATHAHARRRANTWRVAELKIIEHPALNADANGFAAGLAAAGFTEGHNLQIARFDAQGLPARTQSLARQIMDADYDLVHTIATLPSQEIHRRSEGRPVVFSSVTDPVFAGIVPATVALGQRTGTNVTGVSDRWPVELQFHVYAGIAPQAKIWATVYNPAEPNSVVHVKHMRIAAHARGLQLLEAQVHHPQEVLQAALQLAPQVHAFTITSDNTTVSRMQDLVAVCNSFRIPLFAGDTDSVERGAIAAYGLDYHLVGYAAGRKAALILKGHPPGEIAWTPMEKFSLVLNLRAAKQQGIQLPATLQARANRIVS